MNTKIEELINKLEGKKIKCPKCKNWVSKQSICEQEKICYDCLCELKTVKSFPVKLSIFPIGGVVFVIVFIQYLIGCR
jgi:hypothetical protein